MSRKGENIFKRKDGRWEARILVHIGESKKYYSLYGKSYREAKLKKENYYKDLYSKKKNFKKSGKNFSGVAEMWLNSLRSTVKESTYTRYYRNLHSYIMQYFENYDISDLCSDTVNRFKIYLMENGGKRKKGLSEKTVTDILGVLKAIIAFAGNEGYFVMNTSQIRNPRIPKNEISLISDKDFLKLEEKLLLSDESISLGILLALHTGMRNGEICGLKWQDFDFPLQCVKVRRTVERISDLDNNSTKTKIIISEPKSYASTREIPLPKVLCDYFKSKCGIHDTYILTQTNKPCEPHTLYIRYKRFLKRNGFEQYTFHALRHTFATRGIASGFDVKSLSEILGHSDVGTTLRSYVHPSKEEKLRQMELVFNEKIRGQKYGM